MTKNEIEVIIDQLNKSSKEKRAYFGYHEWTPHEFSIKANSDGLKLFASMLLKASILEENKKLCLKSKDIEWYDNELDVHFIAYTDLSRSKLINLQKESKSKSRFNKIIIGFGLAVVIYILFSAILFNYNLIFNSISTV